MKERGAKDRKSEKGANGKETKEKNRSFCATIRCLLCYYNISFLFTLSSHQCNKHNHKTQLGYLLFISEVVIVNTDYMPPGTVNRTDFCDVLQSTVIDGRGNCPPQAIDLRSSLTPHQPLAARCIMSFCCGHYFRHSHRTSLLQLVPVSHKTVDVWRKVAQSCRLGSNTNPEYALLSVYEIN